MNRAQIRFCLREGERIRREEEREVDEYLATKETDTFKRKTEDKNLNRLLCYQECSRINPHLAELCLDIENYNLECPTCRKYRGGNK